MATSSRPPAAARCCARSGETSAMATTSPRGAFSAQARACTWPIQPGADDADPQRLHALSTLPGSGVDPPIVHHSMSGTRRTLVSSRLTQSTMPNTNSYH